MNRTIGDIQKDIELLGIKGGYDIEQLLTPQDCRRLSYEIERLNNIINELDKVIIEFKKQIEEERKNYREIIGNFVDKLQKLKGDDKNGKS